MIRMPRGARRQKRQETTQKRCTIKPGRALMDCPQSGPQGYNLLTLKGLGHRSPAYRATKQLIREIEADLGGAENLSATERQMVQHGAVLGAIAQDYEARYLMGRQPDLALLCRVLKAQRSCFDAIGYRRRQRDVTPTLEHFLGNLKPEE